MLPSFQQGQAVALANQKAWVLWALLARGDLYRSTNVATHAVLLRLSTRG